MTEDEVDEVVRRGAGFIAAFSTYAGIGLGLLVMNLILGPSRLAVWNAGWLIWAPLFACWAVHEIRQQQRALRSVGRR